MTPESFRDTRRSGHGLTPSCAVTTGSYTL